MNQRGQWWWMDARDGSVLPDHTHSTLGGVGRVEWRLTPEGLGVAVSPPTRHVDRTVLGTALRIALLHGKNCRAFGASLSACMNMILECCLKSSISFPRTDFSGGLWQGSAYLNRSMRCRAKQVNMSLSEHGLAEVCLLNDLLGGPICFAENMGRAEWP